MIIRPAAIARRLILSLLLAAPAMAQTAQTTQDIPISARTAADFKALREMPLFSPDRSAPVIMAAPEAPPPVVEVEAPPPPPPPPATAPDWQLVGLVRSDRIRSAMFRSPSEPEFTLRQGESRDGWTLTEVGRFDVTLDSSTGRASMRFPENSDSLSPAMPPMPPMEPQL
jgi:hypothetical protein